MEKGEKCSKHCDNGQINFRQKKTRRKIRTMIYTSLFVCIALTSGAVAATYIVEVKYGEKLKKLEDNKPISYYREEEFETIGKNKQYYKIGYIVDDISGCMVGISKNEESFLNGDNSEENGTGIIVDEDGYVATNYDTIKNLKDIFVKLPSRGAKPTKATVVGTIKEMDIAILKVDNNKLPVVDVEDVSNIRAGDKAILIGNPLAQENSAFMTVGLVCGNNQKFVEQKEVKRGYRLIKTTAVINNFNSGGVLANEKGQVIGINSMALSKQFGDNDQTYVALSMTDVKEWVDNLKLYNNKVKPNLGVVGDYIKLENSDVEGIHVLEFLPGSPLIAAGVRPTDIILEVAGKKVKSISEVNSILGNYDFGSEIEIKILRNGNSEKYKVKLVK